MDPPDEYDWNLLQKVQYSIHKDFQRLYLQALKARDIYRKIYVMMPEFKARIQFAKKRIEETVKTVNFTMTVETKADIELSKAETDLK